MNKWIWWAIIIWSIILCMCFVWRNEWKYGKIFFRILIYCWIFWWIILKDKIKKKALSSISKEEYDKIVQSIKDWTYPTIEVDIPMQKKENTYWVFWTALIKEKKVTTRTNYWWMTWSIKIMKWMRYRLWSMQHQSESHIEEYSADIGALYITNKRFIFKWNKQVIEIKAKDMISMEVIWNTVKIFKNKWNAIKLEFLWEYNTFWAIMMWLNNKE